MKTTRIHRYLTLYFLLLAPLSFSQPIIPHKITFGNLKLNIKPDARKVIADNVKRLTRNEHYFQSIVKRADIFFPIVEEKFREVGTPEDIKYLCLQESELYAGQVQ